MSGLLENQKNIFPDKQAPNNLLVEFSPHTITSQDTCNGGKGNASLMRYDKWTARYQGLCAGGCNVTRIVYVPMSQIS